MKTTVKTICVTLLLYFIFCDPISNIKSDKIKLYHFQWKCQYHNEQSETVGYKNKKKKKKKKERKTHKQTNDYMSRETPASRALCVTSAIFLKLFPWNISHQIYWYRFWTVLVIEMRNGKFEENQMKCQAKSIEIATNLVGYQPSVVQPHWKYVMHVNVYVTLANTHTQTHITL